MSSKWWNKNIRLQILIRLGIENLKMDDSDSLIYLKILKFL